MTEKKMNLSFELEITDEWPPAAIECIPFVQVNEGLECLKAPLFLKNLSVGDIIQPNFNEKGNVEGFRHILKSKNSVVWLLRLDFDPMLEEVIEELQQAGCNTTCLLDFGVFAIDVSHEIEIIKIDKILEKLDSEQTAIAFPSFRH